MPSFLPIEITDAEVFEPTSAYYLRPHSILEFNEPIHRPLLWRRDGVLYQLVWAPSGLPSPSPTVEHSMWMVWKSSDRGETWAQCDSADTPLSPINANYRNCAATRIGDVVWLFFDYGDHPEPGYVGQFDEIRVVTFDLSTESWGTPITGGPRYEPGTFILDSEFLVFDVAYRGDDEIAVLHSETDETESPKRALFSVFNTSSGTWTTLNTELFTPSGGDVYPFRCAFDGTYVHAVSLYRDISDARRLHRTIAADNSLGASTDLQQVTPWPSGWEAATNTLHGHYCDVIAHDGEVFVTSKIREELAPFVERWTVGVWRADAGEQDPAWVAEAIGGTDWNSADAFSGDSGFGAFVVSGGELYLMAAGAVSLGGCRFRFRIYTQQYSGSGSWAAPVQWWDYAEAYEVDPPSAPSNEDTITKFSLLGDGGGSGPAAIDLCCDMGNSGYESDSVYYLRGPELACCCADYAY